MGLPVLLVAVLGVLEVVVLARGRDNLGDVPHIVLGELAQDGLTDLELALGFRGLGGGGGGSGTGLWSEELVLGLEKPKGGHHIWGKET